MSYMNKYEESKKSADLLYNRKLYNTAVNRYYYSAYQKILWYIESCGYLDDLKVKIQDKQQDTHSITIKQFIDILKIKKFYNDKKRRNIRNTLFNIKSLRNKADYDNEEITCSEVKQVKNNYDQFIELELL